MSESFIKALKWGVMVVFVIGGIYGLATAGEKDDFRYIMVTVLSFGAVSLMFKNWSELPGKIMVYSVVVVIALAFVAQDTYVPFWFFMTTEKVWTLNFYQTWGALVMSIGAIVMTFVFKKFD